MSRYNVTLSAQGEATVTVEADDVDAAVQAALLRVNGYITEFGTVEWEVEDVRDHDE